MSNDIKPWQIAISKERYETLLKNDLSFKLLVGTLALWCEQHHGEGLRVREVELILEDALETIKKEEERWKKILGPLSVTDC